MCLFLFILRVARRRSVVWARDLLVAVVFPDHSRVGAARYTRAESARHKPQVHTEHQLHMRARREKSQTWAPMCSTTRVHAIVLGALDKMHLYNLTLQKNTAITCAVYGSFSAPKMQEITVGRGKYIDLLRPDENGHLITICSMEVFGYVRSLSAFRLSGTTRDFLVVGSDSGRVVILDFDSTRKLWKRLHQETYGKSGCRRVVPGQYLATDPRGRAVMVAAVEKQKFVYILNRDASSALTISSPLEAHKSHGICFSICGVDVGFENPVFAALEVRQKSPF